jgi:hypothetical protein
MTLEEAFTGVKLEVGHFRIFGCSGIHLWGTVSLRRNIRSSSLVRDRLSKRQKEMVPSEKERYLRDIHVMLQL